MTSSPHLAVLVSYSGRGGVEKVIDRLLPALADAGCRIDLLLIKSRGFDPNRFPTNVRPIELRARHSLTALPELIGYLRRQRPPVLMAVRHRAIKTAVIARRFSRVHTRIIGQIHTTASVAMRNWHPVKQRLWRSETRRYYRQTDLMIGVSRGVADDIQRMAALPPDKTVAIPNPIIDAEAPRKTAPSAPHPWFGQAGEPVILGAGRLTRQKDFNTLVRAFAMVTMQRPARLIIIGEGNDRPALESLLTDLDLGDRVALPGHVTEPQAWMAHADLFVLSSVWEGFGNVLVEAMAAGTPVVATDCPHGPREILLDGRLGPLVPPKDPRALAAAILSTLDDPPSQDLLQRSLSRFHIDTVATRYRQALALECSSLATDMKPERS